MPSQTAPLVSVVIPCFNQGHFLAEAIGSCLDQDYSALEVIVVNDGSPDNTREVAEAFGSRIVYVEQINRGAAGARNTGIRMAHGEYVVFLDSDDVLTPGSISRRAHYLNTHPETSLVCGDAIKFGPDGPVGLWSESARLPRHRANFRWETVEFYPLPSTVMVRRACFDQVGYFDERMRRAGEDWQMWVRLSRRFNLAYLSEPLAQYRIHGEAATSNIELVNAENRLAVAGVIDDAGFGEYPRFFRARLLYYRFATAWRVEPKPVALMYALRARVTDPRQVPYGVTVVRRGIANARRRRRERVR